MKVELPDEALAPPVVDPPPPHNNRGVCERT